MESFHHIYDTIKHLNLISWLRAHLVVNNRVPFFIDVLCGETSIWYLAWWMEFLSINVTA